MDPVLHRRIIDSANDLIFFCLSSSKWQSELNIDNRFKEMLKSGNVRDLGKGAEDADFIEDVTISSSVMQCIMQAISEPTRFQHFAYCGNEQLQSGSLSISKYAGYCWECDPNVGPFKAIVGKNTSNAEFNENCGYYSPAFLEDHPGKSRISGVIDWDVQIYPSAIDMFSFYMDRASTWPDSSLRFKALGFALHFLHDLAVPHHVLSTLLNGHSGFEEELTSFWEETYSNKTVSEKEELIGSRIGNAVISARKALLGLGGTYNLAQRLVEQTLVSIIQNNSYDDSTKYHHPSEMCALSVCSNAIAATIEGYRLFL